MSRAALAGALLALALAAGLAGAQERPPAAPPPAPMHPGLRPLPPETPATPQRRGELDCAACHVSKHQGVVRMYLGMGGHGTPMIPSHMFQVRVECVACHKTATCAGAAFNHVALFENNRLVIKDSFVLYGETGITKLFRHRLQPFPVHRHNSQYFSSDWFFRLLGKERPKIT